MHKENESLDKKRKQSLDEKSKKKEKKERKEREEQIKFVELKILNILRENTNEKNKMSLEELTKRVYEKNDAAWKKLDSRVRYNRRMVIVKAIETINSQWQENSPIVCQVADFMEEKEEFFREQFLYCLLERVA